MTSTRSRTARRCWLAGLAALIAAAPIAGAEDSADPSLTVSVTPDRVRLPGTTELVYRVRMTTGSEAERFAVDLRPGLLRTRLGGATTVRREGATIKPAGDVALEGPGTLTPIGAGHALIACSPSSGLAAHGYEPDYPRFLVELPANSVSTLVAPYETGGIRLWPGSDLRLTVRASANTGTSGPATLERTIEARSPAVALSGRVATRLELWSTPQSSPGVFKRLRRLPAGIAFTISGRATPARAGRPVSIWTIRHGEGEQARRLATVRTDAAGRLRVRTRTPTRPGDYELWARTADVAGGLPEHSCSMAYRIPSAP